MLENALALMDEYAMLPPGGTVLCAVSGGADSMCLLHFLRTLAEERGFTLRAAHFDHRLRGEESTADAAFVENRCRMWNIPLTLGSGDVAGAARRAGTGIEETARALRYAFLEQTAEDQNADVIATAHNASDNTETVLLHLIRGAGLQGLTGIPPRRGHLVRPFLTTTREEIGAYLRAQNVDWREDSSNADDTYARNYLRHRLLPAMEELNPRFLGGMERTIRLLRQDNDFLNAQAAQVAALARWAEDDLVIEARYIAELPAAIAPRAVRRLLEMTGDGNTDCSAAHLKAVVDLAVGDDPSAVAFLPNGRLAQRVYRELLITTQGESPPFTACPLNTDGETAPAGTHWRCSCRTVTCPALEERRPGAWYLDKEVQGRPVLRPRQTGDELALPGRDTKTLKKWMIDEKIPRRDRDRIPVLADERGVLAAAGLGPHRDRVAKPGQPAWEVVFWKER